MGKYSNAHYIKQKDIVVLLAFVGALNPRLRRAAPPPDVAVHEHTQSDPITSELDKFVRFSRL